ncbi:MAG: GNAT family N-acetyltransferase [Clostridia bacterium]|nr:GNAT family N-acetyltransferase [Clostridia bacterium]
MTLQTQRLLIRPFESADFDAFLAYAADVELCHMIGWPDLSNRKTARTIFDGLLNEEGTCALVDKARHAVIGNISFKPPHPYLAQDERLKPYRGGCLSYAISARCRRQGFVSEAVSKVLEHLFIEEGVDYVNSGFFSFNEPSRRLQEKFGFRYLGTHVFSLGGEEITVIENILWRSDYEAHRAGYNEKF